MSTTVITQSMKYALGISESVESTSVFLESECSLVTQESVKSSVVPQSIRSVPDLSQSAGPIPVSTVMTRITASPPVLAATDITKAVKHAVSVCQKRRRMVHAVQNNALPVLPIQTKLMSPVLSTVCIPACHVMSTEALPKLAASPVMATEASSKQPVFPVASTDAIPASHVKSKNVPASHVKATDIPVSQVVSTEVIPEQPTITVLATKAIPEPLVPVVLPEAVPERPALKILAMEAILEALIQPVMATEAISEHPALPVTVMEAVPKQPVVTAAEAFSESLANLIRSTREILATLTVANQYEIPEEEPPESAMEEVVSKSAPGSAVPEPTAERTGPDPTPPERPPVSAPPERPPEPAPERAVPESIPVKAVPESATEGEVPESAPAPERAAPEFAPVPAPAAPEFAPVPAPRKRFVVHASRERLPVPAPRKRIPVPVVSPQRALAPESSPERAPDPEFSPVESLHLEAPPVRLPSLPSHPLSFPVVVPQGRDLPGQHEPLAWFGSHPPLPSPPSMFPGCPLMPSFVPHPPPPVGPSWYPLAQCGRLEASVGEGTVRILSSLFFLSCLCLMFLCLFCV